MTRARKPPPKRPWREGDRPPPNRIVETVHVEGITYQRKFISCGRDRCRKGCASGEPSHGPYWYATVHDAAKKRAVTRYVGKTLPRLEDLADRPEVKGRRS